MADLNVKISVSKDPTKTQSVYNYLNQAVTESSKEWENEAAAYQDIRHILIIFLLKTFS